MLNFFNVPLHHCYFLLCICLIQLTSNIVLVSLQMLSKRVNSSYVDRWWPSISFTTAKGNLFWKGLEANSFHKKVKLNVTSPVRERCIPYLPKIFDCVFKHFPCLKTRVLRQTLQTFTCTVLVLRTYFLHTDFFYFSLYFLFFFLSCCVFSNPLWIKKFLCFSCKYSMW